jgi:hypothetical protein
MGGMMSSFGNMISGVNFGDVMPIAQAFMQGRNAQNAADQRARAYDINADAMNANAQQAMIAANFEANQKRAQTRRTLASNTSSYLKSGATLEGTPTLALEEQASEGELDALTSLYTGKVQAAQYSNQANLQRYYAQQQRSSGDDMFRSSLITGIAKVIYPKTTKLSFGG